MSKRPISDLLGRPLASGSAAAAAAPAAALDESTSKRAKFDDIVSNIASEFGGKPTTSSVAGIVLGELTPEPKSVDRLAQEAAERRQYGDDDEEDGEDAPRHLTAEEEMDAILQLVDEAPEVAEMDAEAARPILARFSKAVQKNQDLRARYPDAPTKFMESEIALDEACSALTPLSSSHACYPLLLEPQQGGEHTLDTLCMLLLQHENIDVSIDALNLLHEMVDAEELGDGEEELEPLIAYLTGESSPIFLSAMVRALARFPTEHTKESIDAVTHILAIIENLTDLQPRAVSERLVKDTTLVEWLMQRLKEDAFNANKLYASEILSIILTNAGTEGQNQLGATVLGGAGMKHLVKFIAKYRKSDPSNDEETEFVENLFDVLCLSLHGHVGNQRLFESHAGLQLMLTMIRRNTYAKSAAFKAIDFALQRCASSCERFIDEGGLKTVFGALMQEPSSKKERADQTSNEHHLLEIIAQLFLHCDDVRYLRLRRKFEEQEMVKTERTVELLVKYRTRVDDAEAKHRATADPEESDDAVATYVRQSDHGLSHVELSSIILAFLATSGHKELRSRLDQLLHQQDLSLADLQLTLRTYIGMMGDATSDAGLKHTKAVLEAVVGMLAEEAA